MVTGDKKQGGQTAPIAIRSLSVGRIVALRGAGLSLRKIAASFSPCTHRDISRLLSGKEPQGKEKRLALGLPELATVTVCPEHGVVHVGKCPSSTSPRKPRRLRLSVPAWDMERAAEYLSRHLSEWQVDELREYLELKTVYRGEK